MNKLLTLYIAMLLPLLYYFNTQDTYLGSLFGIALSYPLLLKIIGMELPMVIKLLGTGSVLLIAILSQVLSTTNGMFCWSSSLALATLGMCGIIAVELHQKE